MSLADSSHSWDMTEALLRPLSDFAHVTMGQSPDASRIDHHGRGLPFLQGCAEFGAKHPSAFAACHPPLRVAPTGSVLISVRAPVGTMNYADTSYCIGRGLGSFKAKEGLADTVFLKHAVELGATWLHRRSQGSTFAAIAANDLRNVPVPDFPPETQQRIAAILTSLDNAIEATEALIEKHQQIKSGLMDDLFTRGLRSSGELRPVAQVAPEQFCDSPVGTIPREWRVAKLAELVKSDITYGIVQAGPHVEDESGIPYVRTGDMSGDYLDRAQMLCTTPVIAAAYRRSEVREGDIVMAIRASVGKVLPVPSDLDGANLTQGTAKISPNESVDGTFLLWALQDIRFQSRVLTAIKGTTFAEITLADLRQLLIAIPNSREEQIAIADRMQAIKEVLRAESQLLDKLRMQKQGLMQDLLTGKVRVTAPADATA